MNLVKSPFDDVSGQELIKFLAYNVIEPAVVAAGTNLATATKLNGTKILIVTAAAATGVCLPDAVPGTIVYITNIGANGVNVYPPTASQIIVAGGEVPGDAVSVNQDGSLIFWRLTDLYWGVQF